jgi:hypothetical protein
MRGDACQPVSLSTELPPKRRSPGPIWEHEAENRVLRGERRGRSQVAGFEAQAQEINGNGHTRRRGMLGNSHGRLGKRAESEEPGGEVRQSAIIDLSVTSTGLTCLTMSSKTLNI